MSDQVQIAAILTASGFHLARKRKHAVWKHPDGRAWTIPVTPSDQKGLTNNLADLRNFLQRGKVCGTFGLRAIEDSEREQFEKTLHPVRPTKVREIKERSIGIAVERFRAKPLIQPTAILTALRREKTETKALDAYQVGQILRRSFESVLKCLEVPPPGLAEEYVRQLKADYPEDPEDAIVNSVNDWLANEAAAVHRRVQKVAAAVARIFQYELRKLLQGAPRKGQEIQDRLGERFKGMLACRECNANNCEHARNAEASLTRTLFSVGLTVLGVPDNEAVRANPALAWDGIRGVQNPNIEKVSCDIQFVACKEAA